MMNQMMRLGVGTKLSLYTAFPPLPFPPPAESCTVVVVGDAPSTHDVHRAGFRRWREWGKGRVTRITLSQLPNRIIINANVL